MDLLIVLAYQHWIIASLIVGYGGYFMFSYINETAETNTGAVLSGCVGIMCMLLAVFGSIAAPIAVVKFIWLAM